MEDIFYEIKKAFGALWKCRPRGESLEIITPFATTSEKYISVFLTRRDDAWVVTDGGWINKGLYDCYLPFSEKLYLKIFDYFLVHYGIKSVSKDLSNTIYYKGTRDRRLISNLVFDLASFISHTISTALIKFREPVIQERFSRQVQDFLISKINDNLLKFNTSSVFNVPGAYYNAVISSKDKKSFSVVNCVSGTNTSKIRTSIARASFTLDYILISPEARKVENRIVIIDNEIKGFDYSKISDALELCKMRSQTTMLWSSGKEKLIEMVAN